MKPRERKRQAQSSRMYLHNRDHREAIFNDMYHNAMWANTDKIDDKLVWVKYPQNALMHRVKPFTGWMDADRQFCYGINLDAGQRFGNFYRLGNGLCIYYGAYSYSDLNCYVIEDGIVWHDVSSQFVQVLGRVGANYYLGDDTIINLWGDDYWHGGGTKMHIDSTKFIKDEETGEFIVQQLSFVLDCDESWINWSTGLFYMGTIDNTVIVGKQVYVSDNTAQVWTFSIDRMGHVEMLSAPVPPIEAPIFDGTRCFTAVTQQGSRLFVASVVSYSPDRWAHWSTALNVLMSMDGGATWTKEVLFGGDNLPDIATTSQYQPLHRIEMFQRDGEVFLLFGQYCDKDGYGARSVHLYSTYTGTQWDEIALPSWIDIPVLNEYSGQGVLPLSVDTLRIAIRPQETSDQDYNMFDLLVNTNAGTAFNCMDIDHGNILFQDGKMADLLDVDFYMVIGQGNLHIYFDNRYMAESSRAFAWYTREYDSALDGADYVQNGDYCVPYESQTFDPYQYPFWDYYKWVVADEEYVKVPRIELSHYANWHVIVVEYLPTVGANNVLYKVPRYNV